jgi:starch-binding outer membrane protein, SusD/RagB family
MQSSDWNTFKKEFKNFHMKHSFTPLRIRNFFLITLTAVFIMASCSRDYLEVTEPTAISPDVFPAKVGDLDLMLIDVYGRLRDTYFNSDVFTKAAIGLDHTTDQGYNGAGFNEWCLNVLLPTNTQVGRLWSSSYEAIARANAFFAAAEKFRAKGISASEEEQIKLFEGQAHFLRAFYYFYLVQFYGEVPVTSEADKAKLGVPLWDKVATSIVETNKERATIGEVWNFIIADLLQAETLLSEKTSWDNDNRARVNIWGVKGFLGKAYAFTLDWTKAAAKLKEVIDQSGKTLPEYDVYRNMFNGENEFNSESLFEINFTPDNKDVWNNTVNNSTQYGIFISPSYLEDDGNESTNGFGNLFIHDANVRRFGFAIDGASSAEQQAPAFISQSLAVRNTKQVDPRLLVGMLQPYVDSVFIDNTWRLVGKNRGEGFDLTGNKAWCHRKYVVLNRSVWADPGPSIAANMYFLRLADVYLLYAESLIQNGDATNALEYINKVKRRAYGLPVDGASAIDYASLTAATKAAAGDHLANDPLKYERWAELFAEGQWWLDVRRWKIGAKEAGYYKTVKGGALNWSDTKYALPIPLDEMNNNNKIQKQNDGY